MSITVDTSQFSAALKAKAEQINDAVRPAAQAGAERLYYEAKMRAPVSEKGHWFTGRDYRVTGRRYYFAPGNLRDSIYQAYSKDNSGKTKATYHVSWNHLKAPYGFMVEYGTVKAAAHPFMRPAIISATPDVLAIMKAEFLERTR